MQLETNYKEMPLSGALALARRAVGDMRAQLGAADCVVVLTYHMWIDTLTIKVHIDSANFVVETLVPRVPSEDNKL